MCSDHYIVVIVRNADRYRGFRLVFGTSRGGKMQKSAKQILANSFSMLLIFSGILTIVFLLTKDYLLRWFGASADIFPYANTYMTIYTLGTFSLFVNGDELFYYGTGISGLGMLTTLIGAIVNIVLDPVFIFGLEMDIAGRQWLR